MTENEYMKKTIPKIIDNGDADKALLNWALKVKYGKLWKFKKQEENKGEQRIMTKNEVTIQLLKNFEKMIKANHTDIKKLGECFNNNTKGSIKQEKDIKKLFEKIEQLTKLIENKGGQK